MPSYSPIAPTLHDQLMAVVPSRDGPMSYFPCQVTLRDGTVIDRVYISPFEDYIHAWGVTPEEDPGKVSVRMDDVTSITESPTRLPPAIANRIYAAGESGMGYCAFALEFTDGTKQRYTTGNAVDFVALPPGKRASDITRVHTHVTPTDTDRLGNTEYSWCLFSGVGSAA